MPKCKVCGSANVRREQSSVDYLWLYRCDTCGHGWYKSKHKAPGIREGPLIHLTEESQGEFSLRPEEVRVGL